MLWSSGAGRMEISKACPVLSDENALGEASREDKHFWSTFAFEGEKERKVYR
jgi:hypothetical protein